MNTQINVLCIGEPLVELFETKKADGQGTGQFGNAPIKVNGFAGETIPNLANALKQTFLNHPSHKDAKVDLFCAIGNDERSNMLQNWLQTLGLETDKIITVNGKELATVTNFFDENGKSVWFRDEKERFLQQGREESAAREMFTDMNDDDDDLRKLLKDHTHLVVSAVGLGCARDRNKFIRLMQIAKEEIHIPVFFSTNLRPAVWKFDGNKENAQWQAEAKEWIKKALPYVSTILASHSDEKTIFGDENAAQTRIRLKASGIPEVVVTDGARPILLSSTEDNRITSLDRVELTPVKSPNGADDSGAGDAFAGGYIASRIEGYSPIVAAKVGAELGGQMLQWAGSFPPNNGELKFTISPNELSKELS